MRKCKGKAYDTKKDSRLCKRYLSLFFLFSINLIYISFKFNLFIWKYLAHHILVRNLIQLLSHTRICAHVNIADGEMNWKSKSNGVSCKFNNFMLTCKFSFHMLDETNIWIVCIPTHLGRHLPCHVYIASYAYICI